MSDDELPELSTVLRLPTLRQEAKSKMPKPALRRSPRKHKTTSSVGQISVLEDAPEVFLSSQQRASPQRLASPRRGVLRPTQVQAATKLVERRPNSDGLEDLSIEQENLPTKRRMSVIVPAEKRPHTTQRAPSSQMSHITQNAKQKSVSNKASQSRANPYILKEAHCEDLDESSGTDGEDEDTDLSGFIVDDNADLSFYDSENELESDIDKHARPRKAQQEVKNTKPRRKLVQGRKKLSSGTDSNDGAILTSAFDDLSLGAGVLEKQKHAERRKTIEVIDLTSSPVQESNSSSIASATQAREVEFFKERTHDPFANLESLKLEPSKTKMPGLVLPSKSCATVFEIGRRKETTEDLHTPPRTPPRSPSKTKLKSPSKLLSPSKQTAKAPASPHRQSLDAFWDHNVINEWNDTYSPKKAPLLSPHKNPLSRFTLEVQDNIFEESSDEDASTAAPSDPFDESTNSLPSPSESPSKSRSPSKVSLMKAEQLQIRQEKKSRAQAQKIFDEEKQQLAVNLLLALDKYIADSRISEMSASTGGINIIWSKTLRSTAGRANWKRTITKPSGSPIKGDPDSQYAEQQPGVMVKHFASVELAEKIIDRPERLVDTLSHEFCHLANFMVSGVRDQPHGESFKRWGKKVTSWLRSSDACQVAGWRKEWKAVEVTTKHSYIVETKYLWVCIGRPAERQKQSLAMKMLSVEPEDEEGCGAEYGRHSKSIDVEKQRCGRCKGFLVQVRPTPRIPASHRKSPTKKPIPAPAQSQNESSVKTLEKLLEVIELSD